MPPSPAFPHLEERKWEKGLYHQETMYIHTTNCSPPPNPLFDLGEVGRGLLSVNTPPTILRQFKPSPMIKWGK